MFATLPASETTALEMARMEARARPGSALHGIDNRAEMHQARRMSREIVDAELSAATRRDATRGAALALLCAVAAATGAAHPVGVTTLIGDALCDSDAQCRTVAVGARRCGGPSAYLAWSTKRTDAAALASAVDAANSFPGDDDARHSTCGVVADPGAYCAKPAATSGRPPDAASTSVAGQCRLRARARGAAALVDR